MSRFGSGWNHRQTGRARQAASGALERLDSSATGLTAEEADRRCAEYDPNAIAHERRHNPAMQILERLATPLNILLVVFASVSIAVGDNDAGLIILSMVVLSVSLAFVQERRSNPLALPLRRSRCTCSYPAT